MLELERAYALVRDMQPDPAEDEDTEEFLRFRIQASLLQLATRVEQVKQLERIASALESLVSVASRG